MSRRLTAKTEISSNAAELFRQCVLLRRDITLAKWSPRSVNTQGQSVRLVVGGPVRGFRELFHRPRPGQMFSVTA